MTVKLMKNRLGTLLTIVITIIIFYILSLKIDLSRAFIALLSADPIYLILIILLMALYLPVSVKRWQIVLLAMGYHLPYDICFKIYMGALPLNSITPSHSGDILRAYYLRQKIPMTKTAGTILTERVFDLLILIAFSAIGLIQYRKYEYAIFVLGVFIITLMVVLLLLADFRLDLLKNDSIKLSNIAFSLRTLIKSKKAFFYVFFCSIAIWLVAIIQCFALFYALKINIPIALVAGAIPIAILIGMVPISLGGMGTRDAAIIILFSGYAASGSLLAIGLLFTVYRYWLPSIIGLPFMDKMMKEL